MATTSLVGVDGCKAGWIAVVATVDDFSAHQVFVFSAFRSLVENFSPESIIAVDMPIGLPEHIGKGGRGPETLIRPLLGERQSSVFSIPSRSAVYANEYSNACQISLETSDPPRKVSKQAFHLFPKIREINGYLSDHDHKGIYEVHPELAFWRLNGESPLQTPKKIKGRINPDGMEERRKLLVSSRICSEFLDRVPPRGAAADDFLDACACLTVAQRICHGTAKSFPEHYTRDIKSLPIAIWA